MPDYADEPTTELERKARALQWVSIVETATYVGLFWFWLVQPNLIAKELFGFVHGLVFLAFAAMVVMITPAMRWRWWVPAVGVGLGPFGALYVYERIRRHGVPLPAWRRA